MQIAITGISANCALGNSKNEIWENLLKGNSGINNKNVMQDDFYKNFVYGSLKTCKQEWREGDMRSTIFEKIDECLADGKLKKCISWKQFRCYGINP